MPQPYGAGTTVTHQAKDNQNPPQNVGAPHDAVWKQTGVEFYYKNPPPEDRYKKVLGSWNESRGCVELTTGFDYFYGPGATFSCRQGSIETSHGSATAVA